MGSMDYCSWLTQLNCCRSQESPRPYSPHKILQQVQYLHSTFRSHGHD